MILTIFNGINILLFLGIIILLLNSLSREAPATRQGLRALLLGMIILLIITLITFATALRADYHLLLVPVLLLEMLQTLATVALGPLAGICLLIGALRNK
ncbi:MAG TPA: hypothetical protein VJB87_03555 [Candidatus Nanoarchaeia archaeon]|nr:hypothetical protein [Candidatus Nanoarchaeia archaeon]